jgi:hypothetical protein
MEIDFAHEKLFPQEIASLFCHEVRMIRGKRAHEFELVLFHHRWLFSLVLPS